MPLTGSGPRRGPRGGSVPGVDIGPSSPSCAGSVSAGSDPVGKLVPDAYHAALAIESGATFITADLDFFAFPGLAVSRPFD